MKFSGVSKWVLFGLIAAAGLSLDVITKVLAAKYLVYGRAVPVIGEYLQFLLVYNKGAIFGFMPQRFVPWLPVNATFAFFSLLAIAVLVLYYRGIRAEDAWAHWGVSLIMPGALGNLHDRVFHAQTGVVDFIRLGISERIYWPIFNFADMYVTIGVAMILLSFYLDDKSRAGQKGSVKGLPAGGQACPPGP